MAQFSFKDDPTSEVFEFKNIIVNISKVLRTVNVEVRAYSDDELPHYSQLSPSEQAEACQQAQTYLDSLNMAADKGWSLKDDKRLLWVALKMLGLTPTSDIFDLLPENTAIEVYNFGNIQVWRNLKFMDICGYTLEEMFCYSWEERYERDSEAANEVSATVQSILSSAQPQTVVGSVRNVVKERFSEERYILDTNHVLISPVLKGNVPMGFIVASKVEILGNERKTTKEVKPAPQPSLSLV